MKHFCCPSTVTKPFFEISWPRAVLVPREVKGQTISKANYGVLSSSKKQTKLTVLSIFFTQDCEFDGFLVELRKSLFAFEIV